MARYYYSWQHALLSIGILAAVAFSAHVAVGQYTWVTDTDGVGDWADPANWLDGGSNTTSPNGIGVTAEIDQPIKGGVGGYTLDMPATDFTVGTFTIDNTNDDYLTKITMVNHGGRMVFEDPSGTAKWIETINSADAGQGVQNTIGMPILVKNTLEFTQDNYPNLNTGTIFQNRFDGDINSKIVKKGLGGIQFNLNSEPGAGFGFLGQIEIQEGAIRLINNTYSIAKVSGMTVSSGAQLQLADNMGTAVTDYNLAPGAILNLNGDGKNNTGGALQFGIMAGRTTTFHNSVNLQSDSRIHVSTANTFGVIDQAVTGSGDLIKTGSGKLTLTAASSYAGDTRINNGILSITNGTLNAAADVYLAVGTKFDLNFSSTNAIRSLYFDGVAQSIGTWGATGSGATNTNDTFFTGTGILNVTATPTVAVQGDYNNNGVVDAADYVLWRNGGPLQNEVDNVGVVNAQDYVEWQARFGNTSGSGASANNAAVPEPSTMTLLALIPLLFVSGKLRGKR